MSLSRMASISERENREILAANASGKTPVVFIHGLWLLPSSCPVAGRLGADVDDPHITPRVLRRAIGDLTQERKHSCHSVA